jgi:plasmid stabilization system protein ParE
MIAMPQHGQYRRSPDSAESLQENPRRGAIVDEVAGLRKLIVSFGKYGYIIHYAILENDVIILRVYHGRENRPI